MQNTNSRLKKKWKMRESGGVSSHSLFAGRIAMRPTRLWHIVGLAVTVFFISFRQAHSEDPFTYFDGKDNSAYLEWLKGARYDRSTFLPSPSDPTKGAAIHWTISDNQIYIGVAARAVGWVGFGIAESGGMQGADPVIFRATDNSLTDSHILDERLPLVDGCQDWKLNYSQTWGGFLIFDAVRLLDTGDSQDRPIVEDSEPYMPETRIIAAWSNDDNLEYHGPNDRVRSSVRFFAKSEDDTFWDAMSEAEGTLELRAVDYPVKDEVSEYARFCFSNSDLVNAGMPSDTELHTIGMEPMIDSRSAEHIHHFTLFGSEQDSEGCDIGDMAEIAYNWSPGEGPLSLPPSVGGPLGKNGFKSFQLEIHYSNPLFLSGVLDSSGVRLYYTSQKREHDLGVLQLGDALGALEGQSVGEGLVRHTFDCPASCSYVSLSENVTVVREFLHMHNAGKSMQNYQLRDGKVIRVGQVQFWNFNQQGAFAVKQPTFQIQPGDSFQTTCNYDSDDLTFGLSSVQEMCIAYVFYYPRQMITFSGTQIPYMCAYEMGVSNECKSDWTQVELNSVSDLNRSFGNRVEVCRG